MTRRPENYPRKEWFAMSLARRKRRAWELKDNLRLLEVFFRAREICAAHGNELVGMGFP